MKRTICASLALLFVFLSSCGGKTVKREEKEIIKEINVYYAAYGDKSDEKLKTLFSELETVNKKSAEKWKSIIDIWKKTNTELTLNYDVPPDGLPDTDELCLVALGFQLEPDGSMKNELVERLKVLKASAEKYKNALIVCTGGGTAAENKEKTEAGEMAKWLVENGIDEKRVIVEDKSLTTAQNAMFTFDILSDKYPQVKQLAIVSSDYHIATGALLFSAEAILRGIDVKVVSNAAWKAPSGTLSEMFKAGALTELSGDKEAAFKIYYEEYDIHDLPPIN